MKRSLCTVLLLAFVLSTFIASAVLAQAPKSQPMEMYHVVLVKHGPNWKSQGEEGGMETRMKVIENVRRGAQTGIVASAGLVNDETDIEFIFILRIETKTEALNMLHKAETFKSGFYDADIYSWFAPSELEAKPTK